MLTQPPQTGAAAPPPETVRDAKDILRRLSAIDVLRALPAQDVQELVRFAQLLHLRPEERLIDQGRAGDALYFIERGSARVEQTGRGVVAGLGPGSVVGEMALLSDTPRTATVTAEGDLWVFRISKAAFDDLAARSPALQRALERIARQRIGGLAAGDLPSHHYWVATALRAIEARYRGITGWQRVMFTGLILWLVLYLREQFGWIDVAAHGTGFAALQLVTGLLIIQGACEAFIIAVERLGARLRWDGFISGTLGAVISTLPEFFVIFFLARVEPLAAFVTAVITIFNDALTFAIYSFFLPKDQRGTYAMPRSLTRAGGELIISAGAITLIVGIVMVTLKSGGQVTALRGFDLLAVGVILLGIYGYYLYTLVQYYGEGMDDRESIPPDPHHLGHDHTVAGITSMFALGIVGAYCGGEAIGAFAETALDRLRLPTIPTAAVLAVFAGISEYIIVYKAHRRGELGVALSNVFGGIAQVTFMLLPFTLIVIAVLGFVTGAAHYAVPINGATMLLMLLLFPLFYALYQYMEQEKALSNLDAVGLTGIYLLLLYFLFTSPG